MVNRFTIKSVLINYAIRSVYFGIQRGVGGLDPPPLPLSGYANVIACALK